MAELVSILIPAYNAEKWIRATIKSALDQTWPNKEIIIVDDGSRDNTYNVAKEFESKSVKVISQRNSGASSARNKALSFAQGDYIQWLDADDLLASNKISEQMKAAEVFQNSLKLYSSPHGAFYWRFERARFVPNLLWQDLNPVEWILYHFSENAWMSNAGWLVSRRLTEKTGPWDERLSLDDDGEYFCRVIAACENIKFVPEAICYYRRSGFNQQNLQISEKALESQLLSMKLRIQCLRALEDSERTRRASLALLQSSVAYFYPDKTILLEEMNTLAFELGGELMQPRFPWKVNILWRLFGWKMANKIMNAGRKLKLGAAVKWDERMYRITKSSDKFHYD